MSFGTPGSPPAPALGRPPQLSGLPVLRSPQGLALALTVLLSAAAVVNVAATAVSLYTWALMRDAAADPAAVAADAVHRAELAAVMVSSFQMLALLGTAVVFLVWFHRVRANGQVFRPDGFTLAGGWAVGSWFVPLGNFFLPYRIAKETWRASVPLAPGGPAVSSAPLTSWWTLWVLSALSNFPARELYQRADTPERLGDAAAFDAFCDLLTVAAAVLAVLFVRRLTALQHAKALGPYAAG